MSICSLPADAENTDMKVRTPRPAMAWSLAITALVGIFYYFFAVPAINLQCLDFYAFVLILFCAYYLLRIVFSGYYSPTRTVRDFISYIWRICGFSRYVFLALVVFMIVGGVLSTPLFCARQYHSLMAVRDADFTRDVSSIFSGKIPMLDGTSARELGNRKLGELSDMVSQFEVSDSYTQINYRGQPIRITSLCYGDIVKWLNNRAEGLPAYITVNMLTQEANVIRLSSGIKYSPSEPLFRNISRRLRVRYPTYMFDSPHLELDESGTPCWICPRLVKRIGLFGGTDVSGAVIMNAATGAAPYYAEVPDWVDQVFSPKLILKQYGNYGRYANGFLNSLFGQQGVTVTSEGYNFIAIDDAVYIYTGITSVGNDQSNVGFILCNQRTKAVSFYKMAGATERSAMKSAQGVVQHLGYAATFPLLLNIAGQPTYFMSLKDSGSLVKMYAMVNYQQYQIVATGGSVVECEEAYKRMLRQNNISSGAAAVSYSDVTAISGILVDIRMTVRGGTAYYYLHLKGHPEYYVVSAEDCELAVLFNPGDKVEIFALASGDGKLRPARNVRLTD